jgi:hypothetical protein
VKKKKKKINGGGLDLWNGKKEEKKPSINAGGMDAV